MFDCRNDSDALLHHYGVKLNGVLDLQMVDKLRRDGMKKKKNAEPVTIRGLNKIIDDGGASVKSRIGERIKEASIIGKNIWIARPLGRELEDYCAVDTLELFKLRKRFRKTIKRRRDLMFVESEKRLAN